MELVGGVKTQAIVGAAGRGEEFQGLILAAHALGISKITHQSPANPTHPRCARHHPRPLSAGPDAGPVRTRSAADEGRIEEEMERDGGRRRARAAETDKRMRGNAKRFILGTLVLPRSPNAKLENPSLHSFAIFDPPQSTTRTPAKG